MSIFPGEKLQYAETHFKFKLPWSLLYRPWPEILVDAPFQFVPGITPKLWIVVRDAHRFPTEITAMDIRIERMPDMEPEIAAAGPATGKHRRNAGEIICEKSLDLNIAVSQQFEFHPVELGELPAGLYKIHCKIHAARNGKTRAFSRWNFPGLKPAPLQFQVLSQELPKPQGYAAGEMHCHTHYSADHVEHGASPAVFQQAAQAIGLDFVSCTDHAYDFAFLTEDYTREAESPLPRFDALRREVRELNGNTNRSANPTEKISENRDESRPLPLMIAGEEVSVGNSRGENVHMTVLGPEGYLPGLGDCGRNWLANKPTFRIPQIMGMTEAPCFAAHPHQQMGLLEKFVFRRGYWSSKDLQTESRHPVRGIQFWNGLRDEGFMLGRAWWIEELGKENYILPIGGNDAHGDLNDTTAVSLPLFTLKHSRHHVFGKVRTVVQLPPRSPSSAEAPDVSRSPDALTCATIQRAFAGDNCYITDGPALWWERTSPETSCNDGKGSAEAAVTFHARSNQDLGGGFRYVRIYGRRRLPSGKLAPKEELHLASQVATRPEVDLKVFFDNFAYLRAECETATGKFALTSAAPSPKV
ncbi:MAG: hypothetical protein MJY87_06610 [Fibrobacter sp.]|nr:hypothetical protein [Fibrobacter sp.]